MCPSQTLDSSHKRKATGGTCCTDWRAKKNSVVVGTGYIFNKLSYDVREICKGLKTDAVPHV